MREHGQEVVRRTRVANHQVSVGEQEGTSDELSNSTQVGDGSIVFRVVLLVRGIVVVVVVGVVVVNEEQEWIDHLGTIKELDGDFVDWLESGTGLILLGNTNQKVGVHQLLTDILRGEVFELQETRMLRILFPLGRAVVEEGVMHGDQLLERHTDRTHTHLIGDGERRHGFAELGEGEQVVLDVRSFAFQEIVDEVEVVGGDESITQESLFHHGGDDHDVLLGLLADREFAEDACLSVEC